MEITFMKNKIYLSTGAFTGRKNGRNYKLAIDYADKLECDGYELLMYEDFYQNINTIIADYIASELNFPVVHVDKMIGDLFADRNLSAFYKAKEILKQNCDIAKRLRSEKIVVHAWGYPASDENPELICERISDFIDIAKEYQIDLLIENVLCTYKDPLILLEKLYLQYPDLHFIVDTRHAQFHCELEKTLQSEIIKNVRHIHINDYNGGYKEWDKRNPILQPPNGCIDWDTFFNRLKSINYSHSITLEAPSMLENGVDTSTLNKGLKFIKEGLS